MKYWNWVLNRIMRQLWWQAGLYALLGLVTALAATGAERWVSINLPFEVSREAVDSLLNIIASSMLAVTTFSLGAMTSAFGAATSNVTPRATKLLMEDRVTHNVLSSFIGAFLFSIVGIIVLKTGSYGETGRAVLFVITIGVIGLVVFQLLRWINHLISLGRVGSTLDQLEAVTDAALKQRQQSPWLGCQLWPEDTTPPKGARAICADSIGHVQFINVEALSALCEAHGLTAWIAINTGNFIYRGTPVLWIKGEGSEPHEDLDAKLVEQFVIAAARSFEQDPRFGLMVLAEVASRALSPATNDPGTALDVIGRLTRLLSDWSDGREDVPVEYPRLHLRPLSQDDLFEDAFMLIARDGAGLVEIQLRLQKSLNALQALGSPEFRTAARHQAQMALRRGLKALSDEQDIERLKQAAACGQ